MIIKGKLYDGKHAGSRDVRIRLGADGILSGEPDGYPAARLPEVRISTRIGNTPRNLEFPGGEMIETTDHDNLDEWLAHQGVRKSWVHRLESNLQFVVIAIVSVAVICITFAIWGIPWLSTTVAYALPPEINNYIGQGTLATLDRRVFKKSALPDDQRRQLTEKFGRLIPKDSDKIHYHLVFRGGGIIGANAFALPDGTVVVTDELVQLAQSDDEILAIQLHEIGHVVHRHSLRQVISHSSLLALTTVITGDVNSAGSLVLAMPNFLIDSSYSRELETEADTYSLEHIHEFGIAPARFADFMERLERCGRLLAKSGGRQTVEHEPEAGPECTVEGNSTVGNRPGAYSWSNYISSHPPSADRIARFRHARQ